MFWMGLKKAWVRSRLLGPRVDPDGVLCIVIGKLGDLEAVFWDSGGDGGGDLKEGLDWSREEGI